METKRRTVIPWEEEERAMESYCLLGLEFPLAKMKKFWRWRVGMVAQYSQHTECRWTVHLKMVKLVNTVLRIFYYNKKMKA